MKKIKILKHAYSLEAKITRLIKLLIKRRLKFLNIKELPAHLKAIALFAVNTGCRDREMCQLRWEWEVKIPELPHLRVFIVPSTLVKNGEDRLVICNDTARAVVEEMRGKHPTHVFSFKTRPLARILSSGWRSARKKAGLDFVRVHDLKHTFGRRLRSADVSLENRQDLLGHRSGKITTHYSAAELQDLYEAANRVSEERRSGVVLTLLRGSNPGCTNKALGEQQRVAI